MVQPYGFVYITENIVNGKRYIGMCKSTHGDRYLGSGKAIKLAIKKYGKESFRRTILQECLTFEELCEAERIWITKHNAVNDPNFYNIDSGGLGGNSDSLRAYWQSLSPSERKSIRKWSRQPTYSMLGNHHSEDTKRLIGSKSVNRNWGRKTPINGHNNPKAKSVIVTIDGTDTHYDCLKYFYDEHKEIPYSTLKGLAQSQRYSPKHKARIRYV